MDASSSAFLMHVYTHTQSVYLSTCLSIYLSNYPSVCLPIYLYIYFFQDTYLFFIIF